MNILFTNAGRRTYLIEYALELMEADYDLNIFVSDTSFDTAAMHVDKRVNKVITPRVSESEEQYYEALIEVCKENKIEVIIPLMDFELPVLAANKKAFEALGIKVWVSNEKTILNCLNKKENYTFCVDHGIAIPKSFFTLDEARPPYIKKHILGSGSIGLEIVKSGVATTFEAGVDMIQAFVEGKEYGMDILNDYQGNYIHSCFREKLEMRAGETDKARSFESMELEKLAKKISATFKHVGNMDIDFIKTASGDIYLIDFNPRFGGGYPFTHLSGANYLKFMIDASAGKTSSKPMFSKSITGYKGLKLFYKEN
ncbi:MAG: ATP-grasp domain-containing protein [Brumimicrobium sp.]